MADPLRTFTVPVRDEPPANWILVQGPWPITERQWAESKAILEAMRPGLVEPFGETLRRLAPAVVAEAVQEVL